MTSDIIFLQKRDHITDLDQDWVHLDTDENGIRMNRYFVQHPEMILGDMVMESTRFGPDSACKAREGEDLSEQLANAIQFLQAEIKPYELEELDEEEDRSIPADPTVKNFSYTRGGRPGVLPGKQSHAPGGSLRHGGKPYPWHDRAAGMCPQAH